MKTIKDMSEHSRPREKLRERGPAALTDEELVAAIFGMGTAGVDVRAFARQVAVVWHETAGQRKLVEANRELITRMEEKIKAKLAEVWGDGA